MNDKTLNYILDAVNDNYKGTKFEGLDAFERQLKRFSIRIPSSAECNLESLIIQTNSEVDKK